MNKYLFMTGFHQLGIQYSSALSETTCSSGAAALYQQGKQQRPSAPKHPAALPAERPQPSQQGNPAPWAAKCTRGTGSSRAQAFGPVRLSIGIHGVAGWRGDQSPRVYLFRGSLAVSTVKVAPPATPPVGGDAAAGARLTVPPLSATARVAPSAPAVCGPALSVWESSPQDERPSPL